MKKVKRSWTYVKSIIDGLKKNGLETLLREGNSMVSPNFIEDSVGINFLKAGSDPVSKKTVELKDGNIMPRVGFGTWMLQGTECYNAVKWALEAGYRHFDTAQGYYNEADVGKAIADSDVPREEIFVASKLSTDRDFGKGKSKRLVLDSLKKMGLDYFDLYKIHGPIQDKKRLQQAWEDLE
eukprot:UN32783